MPVAGNLDEPLAAAKIVALLQRPGACGRIRMRGRGGSLARQEPGLAAREALGARGVATPSRSPGAGRPRRRSPLRDRRLQPGGHRSPGAASGAHVRRHRLRRAPVADGSADRKRGRGSRLRRPGAGRPPGPRDRRPSDTLRPRIAASGEDAHRFLGDPRTPRGSIFLAAARELGFALQVAEAGHGASNDAAYVVDATRPSTWSLHAEGRPIEEARRSANHRCVIQTVLLDTILEG